MLASTNPIIHNEDAAMYSHTMHNDDIDLDEYTLWDLLGVASSASMNQKQICVALLSFISFFQSPINGANVVFCPDGGTKSGSKAENGPNEDYTRLSCSNFLATVNCPLGFASE